MGVHRRRPHGGGHAVCRRVLTWLLAPLAMSLTSSAPPARGASPEDVQKAVDNARKFLYDSRKGDTWEAAATPATGLKDNASNATAGQFGGTTALAVYALLSAGDSPQDPNLQPAIQFLLKAPITGVYALAFRCQVLALLPPNDQVKAVADKDLKAMLGAMQTKGSSAGLFYYLVTDNAGRFDHSVSQYGVLGTWALARVLPGRVPAERWVQYDRAWRLQQDESGGWGYRYPLDPKYPVTLTMSSAGVASLFITQEFLRPSATQSGNVTDPQIEAGLAWIGKNVEPVLGRDPWPFYALYGIERIGVASGYKYLGGIDWYSVGSDYLVKCQQPDGSFFSKTNKENSKAGAMPGVADTAFGLVFLVRGRAPVAFNKLQYWSGGAPEPGALPTVTGVATTVPPPPPSTAPAPKPSTRPGAKPVKPPPKPVVGPPPMPATPPRFTIEWPAGSKLGSWSERPRDVAFCVRWLSDETEVHNLNWQVMPINRDVAEFHDAPILYIAGGDALDLPAAEKAKLKQYMDEGGIVFGNADGSSPTFIDSFKKLGQELYPDYQFRELPRDHILFTGQQFNARTWKTPPTVMSLSNGVREMMLICPNDDPGKSFQVRDTKGPQGEIYFELAADIYQYAIDKKNTQVKGQTYLVKRDESKKASRTLKVARLQYLNGNWNPEPAGWTRLGNVMHNDYGIDVLAEPVKLGAGKLTGYTVAHLTGTNQIHLSFKERDELKKFVDGGNTLIVDAAGGSTAFASSVEDELQQLLGPDGAKLKNPLPAAHAVYSAGGQKIATFAYRDEARRRLSNVRINQPRVRGVERAGKVALFYSPEDLSAGLVGQAVDGINGYDPATSMNIMSHILLYASNAK